jgi:Ser/Thr protein kinase RdoA (MazF antagonist)
MDRDAAALIFTPAARDALAAFAIEPGTLDLVRLAENATFRVTDRRDGAAYVLRLHRPWYHTHDELIAERLWVRALAAAGIAVPQPVMTRDGADYTAVDVAATGERRYAGLARWTNGTLLGDELRDERETPTIERAYRQLGAIAARLHNQSSAWRPPAGFTRHALDADGLMGEAPFWGPFWAHRALSAEQRSLLIAARDRLRPVLRAYDRSPAGYGVIHADLHPGNVLIDGDRLTVIDFDDTAFGWHAYDIGVALLPYQHRADFAAIEDAFFAGYAALRPAPEALRAQVPLMRMARGMAQIGWFHQRPELALPAHFDTMVAEVCAQCAAFLRAGRVH